MTACTGGFCPGAAIVDDQAYVVGTVTVPPEAAGLRVGPGEQAVILPVGMMEAAYLRWVADRGEQPE